MKVYLTVTILTPHIVQWTYYARRKKSLIFFYHLIHQKANGPDGISATMLKSTAHSIAPGLTKLFNKSISSGKLPSTWKTSSIVPIPKSNEKSSVTNYRPISLLSIISKLLERHIYWQIATHLEIYSPISLHQWGFQPKKINNCCSVGCI